MRDDRPLARALNEAQSICTACGASDEWAQFEFYILACLHGVQGQPDAQNAIPGRTQPGYVGFPKALETNPYYVSLVNLLLWFTGKSKAHGLAGPALQAQVFQELVILCRSQSMELSDCVVFLT